MSKSKPHVLLLTYYWPPAGGPGVQRWLKFVKYLVKDAGFDITVITPAKPTASNYDRSLENEIPKEVKILKTASFEPFQLYNFLVKGKRSGKVSVGGINLANPPSLKHKILNYVRANYFIPDARKGWNYFILKEVKKLFDKGHQFDVVISTGPPHSTHIAAMELKERYGLKWIADFRDPWTNIYYNSFFPRTSATKRKDKILEDKVLKYADNIITVSSGLYDEFTDRAEGRLKVVYNGFDEEDIPIPRMNPSGEFIISYTGNFKPNQNIESVWKALSKVIKKAPEYGKALKIHLVGNVDDTVRRSIEREELSDNVVFSGYVPHHIATEKMVNSNMLLFIIPMAENNKSILTGKLFEYIGSRTPIISIGPKDGNAAQIISQSERGEMIDYTEENIIYDHVKRAMDRWFENGYKTEREKEEGGIQFSRRGAALELAGIIENLIEQ